MSRSAHSFVNGAPISAAVDTAEPRTSRTGDTARPTSRLWSGSGRGAKLTRRAAEGFFCAATVTGTVAATGLAQTPESSSSRTDQLTAAGRRTSDFAISLGWEYVELSLLTCYSHGPASGAARRVKFFESRRRIQSHSVKFFGQPEARPVKRQTKLDRHRIAFGSRPNLCQVARLRSHGPLVKHAQGTASGLEKLDNPRGPTSPPTGNPKGYCLADTTFGCDSNARGGAHSIGHSTNHPSRRRQAVTAKCGGGALGNHHSTDSATKSVF